MSRQVTALGNIIIHQLTITQWRVSEYVVDVICLGRGQDHDGFDAMRTVSILRLSGEVKVKGGNTLLIPMYLVGGEVAPLTHFPLPFLRSHCN
jgi:hypothetical protein